MLVHQVNLGHLDSLDSLEAWELQDLQDQKDLTVTPAHKGLLVQEGMLEIQVMLVPMDNLVKLVNKGIQDQVVQPVNLVILAQLDHRVNVETKALGDFLEGLDPLV